MNSSLEAQVLQIIRDNPEVIMEAIQTYQKKEEEQVRKSREEFAQEMQRKPAGVIESSPTTGSSEQKIVLVEFSDFQCPFCSEAHDKVKTFMEKHQGEVTLTYKHLPLTGIHPQALPAAKASWAAQQQGKFWDYYEPLFTQQDKLGEDFYLEIAKSLHLDMELFDRDRNKAEAEIERDIDLARQLGIQETPFFFLNQQDFSGVLEVSEMEKILAKVKES